VTRTVIDLFGVHYAGSGHYEGEWGPEGRWKGRERRMKPGQSLT
jgi:hypothetical protein